MFKFNFRRSYIACEHLKLKYTNLIQEISIRQETRLIVLYYFQINVDKFNLVETKSASRLPTNTMTAQ